MKPKIISTSPYDDIEALARNIMNTSGTLVNNEVALKESWTYMAAKNAVAVYKVMGVMEPVHIIGGLVLSYLTTAGGYKLLGTPLMTAIRIALSPLGYASSLASYAVVDHTVDNIGKHVSLSPDNTFYLKALILAVLDSYQDGTHIQTATDPATGCIGKQATFGPVVEVSADCPSGKGGNVGIKLPTGETLHVSDWWEDAPRELTGPDDATPASSSFIPWALACLPAFQLGGLPTLACLGWALTPPVEAAMTKKVKAAKTPKKTEVASKTLVIKKEKEELFSKFVNALNYYSKNYPQFSFPYDNLSNIDESQGLIVVYAENHTLKERRDSYFEFLRTLLALKEWNSLEIRHYNEGLADDTREYFKGSKNLMEVLSWDSESNLKGMEESRAAVTTLRNSVQELEDSISKDKSLSPLKLNRNYGGILTDKPFELFSHLYLLQEDCNNLFAQIAKTNPKNHLFPTHWPKIKEALITVKDCILGKKYLAERDENLKKLVEKHSKKACSITFVHMGSSHLKPLLDHFPNVFVVYSSKEEQEKTHAERQNHEDL